ncbi:hypothetical protein HELRODRAFT_155932 [Helobdella robusta]|uniref:glutaminase n=1 Tax=Helobdella robusta TaxID=6412 RepID=T1ELP4_HELRO|nr:hypothetical protein HELRODRAFT_155932 [Helobdella robusta]ESN99005.1 hypothetical protein HELRODRAFT_155932 [Helobdella robusta]
MRNNKSTGRDRIPIELIKAGGPIILNSLGLQNNDPRLSEMISFFKNHNSPKSDKFSSTIGDVLLNFDEFKQAIQSNIPLIKKAFTGDMIIPNFEQFCSHIDEIFNECKEIRGGAVATYIPQLSKFKPEFWAVSICTIDGQRYSLGDINVPFTLQSSAKPISYALAIDEHGSDMVHKYVGYEPSGESFNSIKLSTELKPHNPMINPGAIVVCSLIKNNLPMGERFEYMRTKFQSLAGGEYVSFNNAVFLSERATANRNLALGYYLKEHNCFPKNTNLEETLDFYFMSCSVEVTATSGAVLAATLANGGYCPITQENVLPQISVRNTLALMHSCGMYDYSGRFAFKVGLPAKSAVSGCILLVVPNVMGLCLWSPPLDNIGNSMRGVHFCDKLIDVFNFHHYDSLIRTGKKIDPRLRQIETTSSQLMSLLFAAHQGDLKSLRRLALIGADMNVTDYDNRSALHLAASGGHLECVKFLIERCQANANVVDRWEHTPLDNAVTFKHLEVQKYLESFMTSKSA